MLRKLLPAFAAIVVVLVGFSIVERREARRRRELWAEATD